MRSARRRSANLWLLPVAALLGASAIGCGGSPTAPARDDVFYLHGGGVIDRSYSWEVYFSPLDQAKTDRLQRIVGVGVLNGDVRFGRPIDWYIRGADYTPQQRFISYQSPRQFLFSIYERVDPTGDPWPDVLKRYEGDVAQQGAQILQQRMPVATANAQGREYLLRTRIPSRPDYQAYSHEFLLRSPHRVLLVQVVHGQETEAIADEVAAAVKSMLVY
jgi:hypothetical protein